MGGTARPYPSPWAGQPLPRGPERALGRVYPRRIAAIQRPEKKTFRTLLYSDYVHYRPNKKPSLFGILAMLPMHPGLLASIFLRAQQRLYARGHVRMSWSLRTLCQMMTGAEFVPGLEVGWSVYLAHPMGIAVGSGTRMGDNVTITNGVQISAAKHGDYRSTFVGRDQITTIEGGVFLGSHCVILEGVTIHDHALIGGNSVVSRDVPRNMVAIGIPAEVVAERRPPQHEVDPKRLREEAAPDDAATG